MKFFDALRFINESSEQLLIQFNNLADQLLRLSRERKENPNRFHQYEQIAHQVSELVERIQKQGISPEDLPFAEKAAYKAGEAEQRIYELYRRAGQNVSAPALRSNLDDTLQGFYYYLEDQKRPQYQKIINENPGDRSRYLIAADLLEERGEADEYILTILRMIGEGRNNNIVALGTMSIEGTFGHPHHLITVGNEEKFVFPIKIKSQFQKMLGIREFGELYLNVYRNILPDLPAKGRAIVYSKYIHQINHNNYKKEFVEFLKRICTDLNKGNSQSLLQLADDYAKTYQQMGELVASRSRTRSAPMPQDVEAMKDNILKIFRLMN